MFKKYIFLLIRSTLHLIYAFKYRNRSSSHIFSSYSFLILSPQILLASSDAAEPSDF